MPASYVPSPPGRAGTAIIIAPITSIVNDPDGIMWIWQDSSNNTANTGLDTFTTQGDIVSIALDLDNLVVRFFNNGVSQGGYPLSHGRYCMYVGDGATGTILNAKSISSASPSLASRVI